MLENLNRVPFEEIRYNKISEPCPGTGEWFLRENVFETWRDRSDQPLLWVNGSPGQGKSVLAKLVTTHLEEWVPKKKRAVIYFFCFQQEENFSHAADILRAFIVQLIDCRELFGHLPSEYKDGSNKFFTAPLPELWGLFQTLILNKKCQYVYCIIDALDECCHHNEQRSDLLRRLVNLVSKERSQVKLLITSRPGERDIVEQMHKSPTWTLKADPGDLEKFINSKVEHLLGDVEDKQPKRDIESLLQKQAGRTFLWVSIVVKELARLGVPSLHEIQGVFAENPKDLNELYEKLVARIIATDTPTNTFAKLLIWVAYSERQLSVEELEVAIMCDPSIKKYTSLSEMHNHRRPINRRSIDQKLGTLLELQTKKEPLSDKSQNFVYFNHQSVRDYFHQNRNEALKNLELIASGPDLYLAKTCIWYLNAEEFHQPNLKGVSQFSKQRLDLSSSNDTSNRSPRFRNLYPSTYDFFDYASVQWYKHVKTTKDALSEWKQIENLLIHVNPWLKIKEYGHLETTRNKHLNTLQQYDKEGSLPAFELSNLAIGLDISWLTEMIFSGQIKVAKFNATQICSMIHNAPKSFQSLLLPPHIEKIPISSRFLEQVVKSRTGEQSMRLLFKHRPQEIKITEDLMVAAVKSSYSAKGIVKLLLDQKTAAGMKITKNILLAAESKHPSILQLVLGHRNSRLSMSNRTFLAAADAPGGTSGVIVFKIQRALARVSRSGVTKRR